VAKKTRYEAEKLGRENRHRLFTAELGDATDEVDPADTILTVVSDVVEDYEWSV
jgi:hypothetical protein